MSQVVNFDRFDPRRADVPAADCTEAVSAALNACAAEGASALVFSPGEYHFFGTFAREYDCRISNHRPNGIKRVIFPLTGMKDFAVTAPGARFVFHDYVLPFLISDCDGITLEGFTIHAADRHSVEGVVVEADAVSYVVRFLDGEAFAVRNGVIGTAYAEKWTPCFNFIRYTADGSRAHGEGDHFRETIAAAALDGNCVRFDASVTRPDVGDRYVYYGGDRVTCGIFLRETRNTRVKNVTITRHIGMGLLAQMSENITLDHFDVHPVEGSIISTEADCTHFVNCTGEIRVENGTYNHMMDDALNIHGIYNKIIRSAPGEMWVKYMHAEAKGIRIYRPGDRIALIDVSTVLPTGVVTVKDAEEINQDVTHLTLCEDVTAGVGQITENLSRQPSLIMRGCDVRDNRARGMLLATKGDTLVEGNTFRIEEQGILFQSDHLYWYESGGVGRVVIRGNTFDHCGAEIRTAAVLVERKGGRVPDGYYHEDITLEGNRLTHNDGAPLLIGDNIRRVCLKDNVDDACGTLKVNLTHVGGVDVGAQPNAAVTLGE